MKTILILSPDTWGTIKVSKMHYAVELANMGHKVYFVNPPRNHDVKEKCFTEKVAEHENITIIHVKEHPLRITGREKFYPLFKWIEGQYIRQIRKITGDIDEVWNFNPLFIVNADKFQAKKNLLFMYDFFKVKTIPAAAAHADVIISVAQNILDYFKGMGKPLLLLQHGLAPVFEKEAINHVSTDLQQAQIKIGYVGNLFRQGIDRKACKQIIINHPEIEFHFWGPDSLEGNNVSTDDAGKDIKEFIEFLRNEKNVILHGIKTPGELAKEIQDMSGFLFIYNRKHDMNAASNAHKLMEYLSTGKAVLSMYVSQYADLGLLVQDEKDSDDFPVFFSKEILLLKEHNNIENQEKRIQFALDNTYRNQIKRIEEFIGS